MSQPVKQQNNQTKINQFLLENEDANKQSSISFQQYHDYQQLNATYSYQYPDFILKANYKEYFMSHEPFYNMMNLSRVEEHNQGNFFDNELQYNKPQYFNDPGTLNSNYGQMHLHMANNYPTDNYQCNVKKQQNQQYQQKLFLPIIKGQPFEDQISNFIQPLSPNCKLFLMSQQCYANEQQYNRQKARFNRKQKVKKYLEKKKKRCFQKKITYQCRKDVADKRIRLKGRFINHQQAIQQLGLNPQNNYEHNFLREQIHKLQNS